MFGPESEDFAGAQARPDASEQAQREEGHGGGVTPGDIVELIRDSELGNRGEVLRVVRAGNDIELRMLSDDSIRTTSSIITSEMIKIFEPVQLEIQIGDRIRIGRSTFIGPRLLIPGDIVEIADIAGEQIVTKGGNAILADFRHLNYGWVTTPEAVTSDARAMNIVIFHSRECGGLATLVDQIADCTARGEKEVWLFADDVREMVRRSSPLPLLAPTIDIFESPQAPAGSQSTGDGRSPESAHSASSRWDGPEWFKVIFFVREENGNTLGPIPGRDMAWRLDFGGIAPDSLVARHSVNGDWKHANEDDDLKHYCPDYSPNAKELSKENKPDPRAERREKTPTANIFVEVDNPSVPLAAQMPPTTKFTTNAVSECPTHPKTASGTVDPAHDEMRFRTIIAQSIEEGRIVGYIEKGGRYWGHWNRQKGEIATRDELIQMLKEARQDPRNCAVVRIGMGSESLAGILAIHEEKARLEVEAIAQKEVQAKAALASALEKERHCAINAKSIDEGRAVGNIEGANGRYGHWIKQNDEAATRDELIQMLKEALLDPVNCAVIAFGKDPAPLADILAKLEEEARLEKLKQSLQKPARPSITQPADPSGCKTSMGQAVIAAKEEKVVNVPVGESVAKTVPMSPPSGKGRRLQGDVSQDI